ncbi:MAG: hypothetical protein ACFFCW_33900 [Candidatus Hodarchaeota archaeon]
MMTKFSSLRISGKAIQSGQNRVKVFSISIQGKAERDLASKFRKLPFKDEGTKDLGRNGEIKN